MKLALHRDGGWPLNTENLSQLHLDMGLDLPRSQDNNVLASTEDGRVFAYIDIIDGSLRANIRQEDVTGLQAELTTLRAEMKILRADLALLKGDAP